MFCDFTLLDYEAPKTVKQYVGSITDEELVRRACDGVSSVFHIASIVDVSMFPNIERMNHVNVTGKSKWASTRDFGKFRICAKSSFKGQCCHI